MPKVTPVANQGDCTSIRKVEVSSEEKDGFQKLIATALGPIAEKADDFLRDEPKSPPMIVQTVASRAWLDDTNSASLVKRLKSFQISPRVEECKTIRAICKMTEGEGEGEGEGAVASPDWLGNLNVLLKASGSGESSLVYYVFDRPQPNCHFFGMHRGVVALDLDRACPTKKK